MSNNVKTIFEFVMAGVEGGLEKLKPLAKEFEGWATSNKTLSKTYEDVGKASGHAVDGVKDLWKIGEDTFKSNNKAVASIKAWMDGNASLGEAAKSVGSILKTTYLGNLEAGITVTETFAGVLATDTVVALGSTVAAVAVVGAAIGALVKVFVGSTQAAVQQYHEFEQLRSVYITAGKSATEMTEHLGGAAAIAIYNRAGSGMTGMVKAVSAMGDAFGALENLALAGVGSVVGFVGKLTGLGGITDVIAEKTKAAAAATNRWLAGDALAVTAKNYDNLGLSIDGVNDRLRQIGTKTGQSVTALQPIFTSLANAIGDDARAMSTFQLAADATYKTGGEGFAELTKILQRAQTQGIGPAADEIKRFGIETSNSLGHSLTAVELFQALLKKVAAETPEDSKKIAELTASIASPEAQIGSIKQTINERRQLNLLTTQEELAGLKAIADKHTNDAKQNLADFQAYEQGVVAGIARIKEQTIGMVAAQARANSSLGGALIGQTSVINKTLEDAAMKEALLTKDNKELRERSAREQLLLVKSNVAAELQEYRNQSSQISSIGRQNLATLKSMGTAPEANKGQGLLGNLNADLELLGKERESIKLLYSNAETSMGKYMAKAAEAANVTALAFSAKGAKEEFNSLAESALSTANKVAILRGSTYLEQVDNEKKLLALKLQALDRELEAGQVTGVRLAQIENERINLKLQHNELEQRSIRTLGESAANSAGASLSDNTKKMAEARRLQTMRPDVTQVNPLFNKLMEDTKGTAVNAQQTMVMGRETKALMSREDISTLINGYKEAAATGDAGKMVEAADKLHAMFREGSAMAATLEKALSDIALNAQSVGGNKDLQDSAARQSADAADAAKRAAKEQSIWVTEQRKIQTELAELQGKMFKEITENSMKALLRVEEAKKEIHDKLDVTIPDAKNLTGLITDLGKQLNIFSEQATGLAKDVNLKRKELNAGNAPETSAATFQEMIADGMAKGLNKVEAVNAALASKAFGEQKPLTAEEVTSLVNVDIVARLERMGAKGLTRDEVNSVHDKAAHVLLERQNQILSDLLNAVKTEAAAPPTGITKLANMLQANLLISLD